MKKFFIYMILIVFTGSSLFAQENGTSESDEVNLESNSYVLLEEGIEILNSGNIGSQLETSELQYYQSLGEFQNQAIVNQSGTNNQNTTVQEGQENLLIANITGTGNTTEYTQRGDGNVIVDRIDPTQGGVDHTITQQGDGNQLINRGLTQTSFEITQQGGSTVLIKKN